MAKDGFLRGPDGRLSNSRLIADMEIIFGLLLVVAFIVVGVVKPEIKLMDIALAIGVIYGTIVGSAKVFLYGQKITEGKQLSNTNTDDTN